QGQAELTQPVYCDPGEDVRRGDELVDETTGEVFRVVAAIRPSVAVYLRLDTEVLQAEPAGEASWWLAAWWWRSAVSIACETGCGCWARTCGRAPRPRLVRRAGWVRPR